MTLRDPNPRSWFRANPVVPDICPTHLKLESKKIQQARICFVDSAAFRAPQRVASQWYPSCEPLFRASESQVILPHRSAGWRRLLPLGVCDPEDVLFRPRTVESILACALPFYHSVYSPGELPCITAKERFGKTFRILGAGRRSPGCGCPPRFTMNHITVLGSAAFTPLTSSPNTSRNWTPCTTTR